MSAQTFFTHEAAQPLKAVSFRVLLALYAIIPFCIALQFLDSVFWHRTLQQSLPSSPNHFILFQFLFGTPHIVASSIILVGNSEYLKFFKNKLLVMTLILAVFFGIGSLFLPYRFFYVLVAAWTVYHVLRQQHGIVRNLCKLPVWAFHLMLWQSVAAGLLVYLGIFLKNSLDQPQVEWLQQAAGALCLGLVFSSLLCQRLLNQGLGRWFLWSNTLLVLSSYYLYVQQYYFLAILVPRLVHDATAYIVYVTHDYNKHGNHPQNALYRLSGQLNLPVWLVLPLFSFGLAFVLQNYGDAVLNQLAQIWGFEAGKAVTVGLIGYLALMHYYSEAFTWKQGSPYRKYIAFTR